MLTGARDVELLRRQRHRTEARAEVWWCVAACRGTGRVVVGACARREGCAAQKAAQPLPRLS